MGRESRLSVENVLSHSAEKFRIGILQCFLNFGYRKSLALRGLSRFSIENLLSHSARNFCRGNPSVLCFRKNAVAKKFMDKR